MSENKTLKQFRLIALLEGVSYLLLALTMVLKYAYDIPDPNKVVGMAHGVLFIAYCIYLLILLTKHKWSFLDAVLSFIASLLPFGTFIADKMIFRKYS
jgi:integral membrane protein